MENLPNGWWPRFMMQLQRTNASLQSFCSEKPTISSKTLARARTNGAMTSKTLALIAHKLGFAGTDNLLAEWTEPSERAGIMRLTEAESQADDDRFVALASAGLYDAAVDLARVTLKRAEVGEAVGLAAHWADRVADAYRAMGALRQASSFYAQAWGYVQEALAESPSDFELRWQAARTRFGQIMVDDYMIRGAAEDAYNRHASLLEDMNDLVAASPADFEGQLRVRRLHIRRQQAEMLRMLGRYDACVKVIREVAAHYPEAEYEPRAWAHLCHGGALRLLGDVDGALAIYKPVEQFARDRPLPGLLGSTLVRTAAALRELDRGRSDKCCDEALEIAERFRDRYRFMTIYALLVSASGPVRDRRTALEHVTAAERFGPLSDDYLATEFAHAALCRGELLRGSVGGRADALRSFRVALKVYKRIGCAWGIVRAWIGVRICGGKDAPLPEGVTSALEGLDRQLLARYEHQRDLERGALTVNIP